MIKTPLSNKTKIEADIFRFLFVLILGITICVVWILTNQPKDINEFLPNLKIIKVPKGAFDAYIPLTSSIEFATVKKHVQFKLPFEISAYEITIDQWNKCFASGGCPRKAEQKEDEGGNHPVTNVNWYDAMSFAQWISEETGEEWRLPTEEEWLYVAHAGKSYIDIPPPYTPEKKIKKKTFPVGFYGANEWGMADTNGYVWEWTLSCWYASKGKILSANSVKTLKNPEECHIRVTHGMERAHVVDFIRDTYNGGCASGRPASNLGFRIMRVPRKTLDNLTDWF